MARWSEAESLFHEEVRDKKRTASGVHHKTGKRGYVGKMRFPSDIMSRKDKYNYRKASKVMTTFLYEAIIPFEQFQKEDKNTQKKMLLYWRNNYTNKEIVRIMDIPITQYYGLVKEHDLPAAPRTLSGEPRKSKKANTISKAPKAPKAPKAIKEQEAPKASYEQQELKYLIEQQELKEAAAQEEFFVAETLIPPINPPIPPPAIVETAVQTVMVNGLHIVFNGTYKAEQIIKQLSKFQLLLEDEPDNYYLEFKLLQKQESNN